MDYIVNIMYEKPKVLPGFHNLFLKDQVRFDSREAAFDFINGRSTYDYLDNSARLQEGEKALSIIRENGEHIWRNDKAYVRPLAFCDLKQVEEMDELSGNGVSQWVADLEGELKEGDYAWGLFLGDELIGYCTIGYADDLEEAVEDYPGYSCDSLLLSDVYVKPEYRNQGFATKMVDEVINRRTENEKELVFLTLLYDDLSRFYEKIDFEWAFGKEYIMVRDERAKRLEKGAETGHIKRDLASEENISVIRSDMIDKWRNIYFEESETMIALLELEEANELNKDEKEELLRWSGDDEYAYVRESGELVYIKEGDRNVNTNLYTCCADQEFLFLVKAVDKNDAEKTGIAWYTDECFEPGHFKCWDTEKEDLQRLSTETIIESEAYQLSVKEKVGGKTTKSSLSEKIVEAESKKEKVNFDDIRKNSKEMVF